MEHGYLVHIVIYIGATPITGLGRTSEGLAWSPPANPMGCSFDYLITSDCDFLDMTTADTNFRVSIPTCQMTVTPVVPSSYWSSTHLQ